MVAVLQPRVATSAPRLAVSLRNVTRVHGHGAQATTALAGVDLDIAEGELICVVGASGCGKSTLLSLLAGLDAPTSGVLSVTPRGAALMFQEPALLPWLTVERNVALALRLRGVPRRQWARHVDDLLELVHLEGAGERRPHELSGGMRQRVALARALAQERPLLLMDEPFGALDAITADALREELVRVWQTTGATIVFVTHNVREAVRLGDRVVLMSSRPGRIAEEYAVDLPRPRRGEDADVAALAAEIIARLRRELRAHAGGD